MRESWLRRGALTVAVMVLLGGVPATVAQADPDVSDDDVTAAQNAVSSTAQTIAAIELELAEDSAALDAAWVAVSIAGEDYTAALVARQSAADALTVAEQRSLDANEQVEVARIALGQIAQEAYRSGGSLDSLTAVFSADGYEDFVARTTAIDQVGERTDQAAQEFQAVDLVARILADRANEASGEADGAAATAEEALAQAQELQAAAEDQVAQVAQRREELVLELADLRQTSIAIERARQESVEAERAARADAAARAVQGVPAAAGSTATPVTPPVTSNPAPSPTTSVPAVPDPYGLGTGAQRGAAAQGEAAVAWALQQVGKPYVYGATGPDSFDCSGLTMSSWGAAGVSLNRTARDQYRQVNKISYDSMRPGDLIFWGSSADDPTSVYHVAMYIGDGQMVEAPRPGLSLRVGAIRWASTMPYAGRP